MMWCAVNIFRSWPLLRRMRRALAVVSFLMVFLAGALAGCADAPPAGTGPGSDPTPGAGGGNGAEDGGAERVLLGVEPPRWGLGHYWEYGDTFGGVTNLVVVDETASDWIIGTDSDSVAFFHAREAVSTMGEQRKSDLAGSQDAARVQFYRFPLVDGDSWTTPWDGVERRITVREEGGGVFSFTAHDEETLVVRYVYDAAVGWFRSMDFLAPDGSVDFGWSLRSHGQAWAGEHIEYSLVTIADFHHDQVGAYQFGPRQFEVGEDITDVWAHFAVDCTAGVVTAALHPLRHEPDVGDRWGEVCQDGHEREGSFGHATGTWTADFVWQGTEPAEVTLTIYLRTRTAIPVGA